LNRFVILGVVFEDSMEKYIGKIKEMKYLAESETK